MARLKVVTGGAKSGKSAFVEATIKDKKEVCYIATGLVKEKDPEWQARVLAHQKRRPDSWVTHEAYLNLDLWISDQSYPTYLLDSATMLTSNLLFDLVAAQYPDKIALSDEHFLSQEEQDHLSQSIMAKWHSLIEALREKEAEVWIVTDEVGLGIVPQTKLGRFFRDLQGTLNQELAKEASEVYIVICGLAQQIK
ncbi:bifunctional adenosylcobinamide kinase/adenosylcobinamide-phosphate guanylyltransferase [Streptococcus catagoni]|uniref:bifunctional adenosylcobinamide kinase/adenosylcobinamide-phosphate guanylyltransferase n=1 Tax=Streptococcus catagoni TaxID=2654874 RepID=UPI00140AB617|nr:bifunctional adenosylcobinamide kinase/adenosylcobinamide-phosphate guanylyltransferase [Streptococcus catagoni]